jgi:hypothetical protein
MKDGDAPGEDAAKTADTVAAAEGLLNEQEVQSSCGCSRLTLCGVDGLLELEGLSGGNVPREHVQGDGTEKKMAPETPPRSLMIKAAHATTGGLQLHGGEKVPERSQQQEQQQQGEGYGEQQQKDGKGELQQGEGTGEPHQDADEEQGGAAVPPPAGAAAGCRAKKWGRTGPVGLGRKGLGVVLVAVVSGWVIQRRKGARLS